MVLATLYIMWCSAKNRLHRRLRRLREPRYLIGGLVGAAYLFFALYGRTRPRRTTSVAPPGARRAQNALASFSVTAPALGGLALLVAAAVSWLMPFGSGLLEFTPAETALLFPAPVSRRHLLFYRLMRSQWAVFFGALVMSLAYPIATIPARIRGLLADVADSDDGACVFHRRHAVAAAGRPPRRGKSTARAVDDDCHLRGACRCAGIDRPPHLGAAGAELTRRLSRGQHCRVDRCGSSRPASLHCARSTVVRRRLGVVSEDRPSRAGDLRRSRLPGSFAPTRHSAR